MQRQEDEIKQQLLTTFWQCLEIKTDVISFNLCDLRSIFARCTFLIESWSLAEIGWATARK